MKLLLEKLNIKVKEASSGTLYIEENDIKIRISNHEPNFGAPRALADYEIYTHNITGKEINDKYDVLEKVAEILNIEIKGSLKASLTKAKNKKAIEKGRIEALEAENNKRMAEIKDENTKRITLIKKAIEGKENLVLSLIAKAEEESNIVSNGDKRRKKRRKIFNSLFLENFNFKAELSDVNIALK